MKNLFSLVLLLSFLILAPDAFGQSKSKIYKADNIVWYGIDFSNVRLIGSEGFTDPRVIKESLFGRWNDLIVAEADKYNIPKYYQKNNVYYDLDPVFERNETVDWKNLKTNKSYTLNPAEIPTMVGLYSEGEDKEGLGLVMIVESFNKRTEKASVYLTFFDIETKEIHSMKKYEGKPGGFGLRNYWAAGIRSVFEQSAKDYKSDLKAYNKKRK